MRNRQADSTTAVESHGPPPGLPTTRDTTKHIVMWKVRGETSSDRQSAITLIKSLFEDLIRIIPGMLRIEIGVDISRIDYACDVVLVSEFEDDAALAGYASHPAHLSVRDQLNGVRTERHQVDYRSSRWSE